MVRKAFTRALSLRALAAVSVLIAKFDAVFTFWVVACGATGVLESIDGIEVIGVGMPGILESTGGAKVIGVGMPILAGANLGAGGRIGSCGIEG